MDKKVLYFEGAGMNTYESGEDVGNHRIRTAFKNNNGEKIYLELVGHNFNDKRMKKFGWYSHIDHLHYIKGDDDCNKHRIDHSTYPEKGYTRKQIVDWVNKVLNCSFDDMEVLHDMEGYRVHGDNRTYNLMDNHVINRARTEARIKAYDKIDKEWRDKLGSKYSVLSKVGMDDNSITLYCHTYAKDLYKVGLTDENRYVRIEVNY